jgi:hypothetical protein
LYIRQQQRFSFYGRKIYYNFFGIYQLGIPGIYDELLKPIFLECFLFNTFLTKAYIEKHKNSKLEKMLPRSMIRLRRIMKMYECPDFGKDFRYN